MNEEMEKMRKELDATKGAMAGLLIGVTALIQTHPHHRKMHLVLSELIDRQKGGGALWKGLSPAQVKAAELMCSTLQQIRGVPLKTNPSPSSGA